MLIRALVTLAFVLFCVAGACAVVFTLPLGIVFLPFYLFFLFCTACGTIFVWAFENERPRFRSSDIYFPPRRNYKSWNSIHGWPRGGDLFYECNRCQNSLPSQSSFPKECGCGNLFIGPDHIGASNPAQVRLYEE